MKYEKIILFTGFVWVLLTFFVFASENYAGQEGGKEQRQMIAKGEAKRRKFIQEDLENHPLNLIKLVRDITNGKVNRNGKVYDIRNLSDRILFGLPEATVVTITDGYFYQKKFGVSNDNDIFKSIMAARLHDRMTIHSLTRKKYLGLTDFITKVLEIEEQGGFLTTAEIDRLIKRYKEIMGID